jgi:hypothetical protein
MTLRILLFFLFLLLNSLYGAVLMAVPGADRLFRLAVFAGDAVMIFMAASVVWRNRSFAGVRYLLLFLFVSTLTLFFNLYAVAVPTHLNGLRQPLFLLSTLIVLYDISQSSRWDAFQRLFNAFLVIFALLQIPLSLIQFIKYGAGDFVGGSFGYLGGSGFLTQLAFLITFYFIARSSWLKDPDSVRLRSVLVYSLFLLPCTVNETKISFIYLAVFFVLLTTSRRKIWKSVPILAFGVALILILNYYYGKTVEDAQNMLDQRFLERYLLYDPREDVDVPRFQKLVLMFRLMHGDVAQMLLGLGYGVFAGENILGTSSFGRSLWYFQGTRIQLQTVWIQGGLLAVLLLVPCSFWFLKRRAVLFSGNMRRFHTFLILLIASVWMYNEALYSRTFAMIAGFMIIWIGQGGMDGKTSEDVSVPEIVSARTASEPGAQ